MESNKIKDRVLQLINREKLSSSKFAEIIGVQRSSISHIISGRNKPSLDFIQKVLEKFSSLNPNWLITGNGGMYFESTQNKIDFSSDVIKTKSELAENKIDDEKNKLQNATINSDKNLQEKTAKRKIEKIIVFYNDNSFETLNPEN